MRKLLAFLLAVAMLCTGAFAAEWAEGCSPENPYANAQGKAVDFAQTTGYMMFNPANGGTADYGVHSVTIYMPRTDLVKANGTLYLNTADGTLVAEITLSDCNFTQREMTEEELYSLNWGCGTAFTCEFGIVLPADTEYVVQLSEGAISAPEYGNATPAIAGRNTWAFTVGAEGEMAIDSMYAIRPQPVVETEETDEAAAEETEETAEEEAEEEAELPEETTNEVPDSLEIPEDALPYGAAYQVGDTLNFIVRVGGKAASASIFTMNGTVYAEETYFEQDAVVSVTLPEAGDVEWGVLWQDENGNVVKYVTFSYPVSEAVPVEATAAEETTEG